MLTIFYWKAEETPTKFEAVIAVEKLTLTELKKKLPYRWWKILNQNTTFKNWLKTRERYNSKDEDYVIEMDERRFYEKYVDDEGEHS